LSVNQEGNYVEGNITEEANLAFKNFFAALTNAGFDKTDVVFIDLAFDYLPDVNKLYIKFFPEGQQPARTMYQAEALPFGGKIKVTGTAAKS